MSSTYGETATDLLGLLREVVVRMKQIAQADIVALYPFDADSETFYAPVAIGISDEGLLHSLPDMADQLRRYRADAEQGKVPEDLQPAQYGPNVWLKVTHRALVAEDTPSHSPQQDPFGRWLAAPGGNRSRGAPLSQLRGT